MKAIVCDIGHTIITDSILNKILIAHNKVEAVGKLYDEEKMDLSTQNTIDLFVKKMFINNMLFIGLEFHKKNHFLLC